MDSNTSKVTIHMVASADFFIAKKDGTVDWLETSDTYEPGVAFDVVHDVVSTIDCYVMGSRTYEDALRFGWPYGDTPVYVLTRRNLAAERESVVMYAGDLDEFVTRQLKPRYDNIWVVGGAMVAKEFVRLNLADDLRLTIAPILLGDGTPFFDHLGIEQPLHLKDVTAYQNGFVELWYEFRRH